MILFVLERSMFNVIHRHYHRDVRFNGSIKALNKHVNSSIVHCLKVQHKTMFIVVIVAFVDLSKMNCRILTYVHFFFVV
jgi:ABC-type uncharacterized transport system substrate-binding protein